MRTLSLLLALPAVGHAISAPTLNPETWLLDAAEVTEAMGGIDRVESLAMSVYTTGNEVEPLNGMRMFDELLGDVLATKGEEGDYILYSAWAIQPNITLDPRGTIAPGVDTRIGSLWSAAITRGVRCLTLLWRNELNVEITRSWSAMMQAAAEAVGADEGQARSIVDGRTKVGGSHHQKSLVIKRNDEAVAYLGGIDVTHDRWDTPEHCCSIPEEDRDEACADTCATRETEPNNFRPGWQDVSVRLRGPAVLDVAANFLSRWNDDEAPSWIPTFYEPAVVKKAPPMDPNDAKAEGVGTVAVQILRTFSCSYQPVCAKACYSANAPNGDVTYLHALVKAIHNARNFVYLEDQYGLYQQDYHEALDAALARGLGHVVVLIQPPDQEADQFGYSSYQAQMWDPLKEKYPGRVTVYARNDGTYVHSKVAIVDDVWMSIGSQNLNYRSLTSDTELAAAMVDEKTVVSSDGFEVAAQAFEFRTGLWAAALGVPVAAMQGMKIDDAVKLWAQGTDARRVAEYVPTEKSPFGRITQKVVDGDGRCYGWIKGEEEEEGAEKTRIKGGFGGDISESWM